MDRFLNYTLHYSDDIPFSKENKEDFGNQKHDNELPTRLEGILKV